MNENIIDQYLLIKRAQGCSPATISAYRHDLKRFWWWCTVRTITDSQITPKIIAQYLTTYITGRSEEKQVAAIRSNARRLTALKGFLSYCHGEAILPPSARPPFAAKAPPPALRFIPSRNQVLAFLRRAEAISLKHHFICSMLYYTGCRASEFARLTWADVIANDQAVQIHRGKGGHSRVVPFGTVIAALVAKVRLEFDPEPTRHLCHLRPSTAKPTRKLVWNIVHAVALDTGMDISPHSLRHAFASHIANKTPDALSIAALLGHRSLSTAMLYVHHSTRKLAETVKVLDS